jgi:hypothetical protein
MDAYDAQNANWKADRRRSDDGGLASKRACPLSAARYHHYFENGKRSDSPVRSMSYNVQRVLDALVRKGVEIRDDGSVGPVTKARR